jgi:predicted secreted Zn-dependent protease
VKSHFTQTLFILFFAFVISFSIYLFSIRSNPRPQQTTLVPTNTPIIHNPTEIPYAQITIVPDVEYTYYPVFGTDVQTIQNELDGALGTDKDNNPVTAYAAWDLNWDYPKIKQNGSCRMGRPITMMLDVDYTMPKWEPEGEVTQAFRNRWDTFFKKLTIHEEGHIQIAIDTAYETLKQFYTLQSYKTCQELDDAAYMIGRDLKYAAWDKGDAYDDATNHGETQGARF